MTDETGAEDRGARDDALVADLRRLASQVEPVPESLVGASRELLTWRRVDAELAELLSDSELEDARLELVRGDRETRSLSFETGGLTIEIDVLPDGARRRLVGQVVPPEAATVELQTAERSLTTTSDSHGRFHAEAISPGRMRLRITGHSLSERPVETSWISI